jgi:hypothetical protein
MFWMLHLLKEMVLFREIIVLFFFKLGEKVYFEQNELFATMKTLTGRKYSSQKLTQFLQGNNVLDAPASNIDGFLSSKAYVSSTLLNRPISNKVRVSSTDLNTVIWNKLSVFSPGKPS